MVRYSEEDERKLLEMLAKREGTDDNIEILSERMETPTGAAATMLEAIQGLLDMNLALIELLLHREVLAEDEVLAALEDASARLRTDMNDLITGSALGYIQDGDARLARLAGITRRVQIARRGKASE
jgi:hypothetical protein